MEDLAVAAVGIAIVWLVFWFIRFDRSRSISDHRGPFRMRADSATAEPPRRAKIGSEAGLERRKPPEPS